MEQNDYPTISSDVSESSFVMNYDGEYSWIKYSYCGDPNSSEEQHMFLIAFNNCIEQLLNLGVKYYLEKITQQDLNENKDLWTKCERTNYEFNLDLNILCQCEIQKYRENYLKKF